MSHPLLRPLEELLEKWEKESALPSQAHWTDSKRQAIIDLERVLKESGLADLLEAGQAMREQVGGGRFSVVGANWDQALAKVRDLRVKVEQSRDGFINGQPYVLTYSDIIERLKEIELLINRKIVEHFRALINNNFSGQG